MAAELKVESRTEAAPLTETELNAVVAGAGPRYDRMMELISKVMQSTADIKKAIIGNIR